MFFVLFWRGAGGLSLGRTKNANLVTYLKRESSIEYSSGYVSVDDGTRIFYRTYGLETAKKIPLLCLSGLTRNSSDFHELASKFGEERFVIALDYRGRGHSDYSNDWKKYMEFGKKRVV